MKKVVMMMAMLAVSFTALAQSKFHDVEANEATGPVKSISTNMMGRDVVVKYTYNDKGAIAAQTMDMDGQEMNMPYIDYKYDDRGNWISHKSSMMGREMEQTRKIEYYE